MPASKFSKKRRFIPSSGTQLSEKNFFDLRGLNIYLPDETMPDNESPYAKNFRVYDKKDGSRTTISKRKGHIKASTPIGESITVQQSSTAGASVTSISTASWRAEKFTTVAAGRVSTVSIKLDNATGNGRGPIIVELRTDNSGVPGVVIATSSINQSQFTSTPTFYDAYFIEAPDLTNATNYWIVVYIQGDGTGTYNVSTTTNTTLALTSNTSGGSWTSVSYSLNYKLSYATPGPIIGQRRFYRTTSPPQHLFWHAGKMYQLNEVTGAATELYAGIHTSADAIYTTDINNKIYFIDQITVPKVYNGTSVSNVGGSPPVSRHIARHKNRLFLLQEDGKLIWSEVGDYERFNATSFLYCPTPYTSDPPIGIYSFQDNLVIYTRNTKYILYGSDIASFVLKEATAKKGLASTSAAAVTGSYIYFLSDDGIYRFNGGTDQLISKKVTPIVQNFADKTKVDFTVHDDKLRVYYRSSGQGYNDHCLIYDTVYNTWLNDKNVYVENGVVWDSSPDRNQLVVGNSRIGMLLYAEEGRSDAGKPIEFEYRTKYHSFGSPSRKQRMKRLYPALRGTDGNHTIDVQVDADEANAPMSNIVSLAASGDEWGGGELWASPTATWGRDALPLPRITIPGQNRKHQIRFVQTGVDNDVDLVGYTAYISMRRPV